MPSERIEDWTEAERLFWLSYVTREERFGSSHPQAIRCLKQLSLFYRDQGKFAEWEVLGWRIWETETKGAVSDSLQLPTCLKLIAGLYAVLGKYADAMRLTTRIEEIRSRLRHQIGKSFLQEV